MTIKYVSIIKCLEASVILDLNEDKGLSFVNND